MLLLLLLKIHFHHLLTQTWKFVIFSVASSFALHECMCDTTKYTNCAASYLTYHSQRISYAIVMTDALSITREILRLKKIAYGPRPAQ